MTEPARDTVLQLAPAYARASTPGVTSWSTPPTGTVVDLGPRGYRVLSLFTRPIPLDEAVDRLGREGGEPTELAPTLHALDVLVERAR